MTALKLTEVIFWGHLKHFQMTKTYLFYVCCPFITTEDLKSMLFLVLAY